MNKYFMLACAALAIAGFWQRNDLTTTTEFHSGLSSPPKQVKVTAQPSQTWYEDVKYAVQPLYTYELHGLVVSYRYHGGNSPIHRLSNDHLNMMDLCVVWGDTALSPYLRLIQFWSGQFTCNWSWSNRSLADVIHPNQISNNHLLSTDPEMRKAVKKVRVGDQIRLEGYLAQYSNQFGNTRGTSITREDSGNGACETVWVQEFEILRAGNNPWRNLMWGALLGLALSLVIYYRAPLKVQ
jgi:hypothetical protein